MQQQTTFFDRMNNWLKNSITLKLVVTGILILLLMIPSSMVQSLIAEREGLRDDASREVSSKWGGPQTISGPVISVPYTERYRDEENHEQVRTAYAHFLPEQLNVSGALKPEKRYRGIYVVVLYNTQLKISGRFAKADVDVLPEVKSALRWNEAILTMGITDMKGIRNKVAFQINQQVHEARPGTITTDLFPSGVHVPHPMSPNDSLQFEVVVDLNGSSEFNVLPFGKETSMQLSSPWSSPSFQGDFLPEKRQVQADGFTANWRVLQLNRNYPQQGTGNFVGDHAGFGVKLLLPVDEYQKTMRSAKYGMMFIIITFLSFFFIEIINRKRIHTVQYLLVGFAVVLFYVLLLSISEHLNFNWSYGISSLAIVGLITAYAYSMFQNVKLTGLFSTVLVVLYVFFYSLLQLEDYALLLGSVGLFLILATIMYLTRKIDWYGGGEIRESNL